MMMAPEAVILAALITACGSLVLGLLGWRRGLRTDQIDANSKFMKSASDFVQNLETDLNRLRVEANELRIEVAKLRQFVRDQEAERERLERVIGELRHILETFNIHLVHERDSR